MAEQITNIRSKIALGRDGEMYEIRCDIQREDGSVEENIMRIVTESQINKWIASRKGES